MPLESLTSRIAARLTSNRIAAVLTSSACGILAMCWIQQALAGFGTSLISQTALTIVTLAAFASGLNATNWLFTTRPKPSDSEKRRQASLLIVLQTVVAFAVLFPGFLYDCGWATIDIVSGQNLPSATSGQVLTLTCGLTAAWFVPLCVLTILATRSTTDSNAKSSNITGGYKLTVAAASAAVAMTFISGPLGLGAVAVTALVIGLAGSAIEVTILFRMSNVQSGTSESSTVISEHADAHVETGTASSLSTFGILSTLTLAVLCGILFAALCRVSGQLFFASAWQMVIQCSVAISVAVFARWRLNREATSASQLLMTAAAWSVLLLVAWPGIVSLCLNINSEISSVAIAGTLRAIIAAVFVAPVGLAVGAACAGQAHNQNDAHQAVDHRTKFLVIVAPMLLGWLGCQWVLIGQVTIPTIVVGISLCFATAAAVMILRHETHQSFRKPALAICGIALLASPFAAHRYDPAISSKLLFDTAVFVANHHEARSDILPFLDEGRCLASAESAHGTLTFWRYRGQQLQVRESGLPVSSVSCDTNICTQPSAESLQAILPMVMHEGPTRLMLLGVRSGAVLQTSIAFPLESVVCVESDRKAIGAVSDHVFSRLTPNPLDDSRIVIETAEPLLKLRTSLGEADIIIASADQQGVPQASSMVTTEFLQTASSALREGGLFCQPLDYADFGPDAFQIIVKSWQSVFSEVAAIEIAPGKLLLVATNSSGGIIRPGIIDRLQRPNVRFALAQTGWDWSTPLRLSIYTDKALTTAFGESLDLVSNVQTNRLTCLLPWEVMRWGDKYTAIMEKLGPVTQTLQFTVGEDAYTPEVNNRLAELTEQQNLINDHPDEYWFYRRMVKKRLKDTPQSELVQVKGEEPLHELHENEKRRVDYFTTLGTTAKQKKPNLDDLLSIEEFASPHDPLISLFLHQELAELATRNREENFEIELQHRLHRIYFTASTDQAVRNVISAIEIICEHPEAIADDTDRADQLDALLQVLHDRWHNRGETPPGSSKIVLNDIEKSVSAIDRAFTELARLSTARGYSTDQWNARRLALEKSLLRPLQAYRTTLMPHHAKKR